MLPEFLKWISITTQEVLNRLVFLTTQVQKARTDFFRNGPYEQFIYFTLQSWELTMGSV